MYLECWVGSVWGDPFSSLLGHQPFLSHGCGSEPKNTGREGRDCVGICEAVRDPQGLEGPISMSDIILLY